ncbi:MAG TPA: HlyD family efflux transporter periplasmic adaptor subunit, partial [Polyangiaceae bacterium]|nr:HlyD family efflux transporter periplasmic adaptor subunit [Polyangiaceae bacterium]
ARANVAADVAEIAKQQDEAIRRLRSEALVTGLDAIKAADALLRERGVLTINREETALASADLERVRRENAKRALTFEKELGELKSQRAASRAILAQQEWEIGRRTLRAPIDGTIADTLALPSGAAVDANQTLATLVPQTKMRWVAHFAARESVGRIRAGQNARIRLDAFPWTAYSALSAKVVRVGSEPRAERVRVELEILSNPGQIALTHGMTGTADVEVESVSPLRLLLRLAGQASEVVPPRDEPAPEAAHGPEASLP